METKNDRTSRRHRWLLRFMLPLALVASIGLVAAACGDDDDATEDGEGHTHGEELTATDAWARFPKEDTGAVYVQLSGGAEDDALIGAKVEFAMAEIHETVTSGATSSMQAVEEIPVPANDHVTLEPGGYHIMLMMVQQVPEVGSTFEIELEFKNAGVMTIPVEVRAFE